MALAVKDILLDENNVLRIENGDDVIGYSDGQHVRLNLFSNEGVWRQNPLVGIGIRRSINMKANGSDLLSLRKMITVKLVDDGYRVDALKITSSTFSIDYERVKP